MESNSEGRCDRQSLEAEEAKRALHEHKELVTQLEKDLAAVNALSARFRGEGEGEACTFPVELMSTSVPPPAADSLLPIISSQRERFRQRNQQLEDDNLQLQQQRYLAESEVERLRNDNIKLYEKIKFLQSYPPYKQRGKDAIENLYSTQYEQQLDPFASFSRQEHQRRYLNMGPLERLTLRMGRWIMSNGTMRVATLLYGFLLHCLVFVVLFQLAQTGTCKRDAASDCAAKFAAHMQMAHNDKAS